MTAVFDSDGSFLGHEPRECGEHRTLGEHRAWCSGCEEYCYPTTPCVRCEVPKLRADSHALDLIAELLSGEEWDGQTIELVAELVQRSGREIRDPAIDPQSPALGS